MKDAEMDNQTIRAIVERYSDMIMRIAYQNTRDYAEAEDILQDVYFAMLKRTFESEEHRKAWLIRATVNKCKNYWKSARRKNLPLEESRAASAPERGVMEELFSLPAPERTVLYLHYYEKYTAKEIGKMLRKSENAVFILLSRARKHLKLVIEGERDED